MSMSLVSCERKCSSPDGAGASIWLGQTNIIAPSAFTPHNEDGINDTYTFYQVTAAPPPGSGQQGAALTVKDFGMEILRGGQLIFETHTWGASWNGKTSSGKRVDGLVDVQYTISGFDGEVSEGSCKLFVVPRSSCLQTCMHAHILGDMIDPYEGAVKPTKETFCD